MTSDVDGGPIDATCPKRMHYGPCGGVTPVGDCEVPGRRCAFVHGPLPLAERFDPREVDAPSADALTARGPEGGVGDPTLLDLLGQGGVITGDLTVHTTDPVRLLEVAGVLDPLTAVVAGEPPGADRMLAPSHKSLVLQEAGARVIAGLTCRDRNRVALEGELAALADVGVAAVLAVTGDHPAVTVRSDAAAVFDLDSTRLATLCRRAGLVTAVAEQPSAPPQAYRGTRLALKVDAGAQLAFLNMTPDLGRIAAVAAGADVPVLPTVPVVTSAAAATRLARLPGAGVSAALVAKVVDAADPVDAGVRAAAALALHLLRLPGVGGVHLSAVGGEVGGLAAARAIAATARRIRAEVPAPTPARAAA